MNEEGSYSKNYYTPMHDNSGFKFRVDGRDVVADLLDALRGGVTKTKYGKVEYNKEHRLINDLGISRLQLFFRSVVNKNTHLSKYADKEMILSQVRALSKEWCMTTALNRKRWEVSDPDLVQVNVESTILSSLLRADEGFEAQISGKSHQVSEIVQSQQHEQGFLQRINPFSR